MPFFSRLSIGGNGRHGHASNGATPAQPGPSPVVDHTRNEADYEQRPIHRRRTSSSHGAASAQGSPPAVDNTYRESAYEARPGRGRQANSGRRTTQAQGPPPAVNHTFPDHGFGRHTAPRGASPPPLWNWFTAVDRDESGDIDADELQEALLNDNWTHFDTKTVDMLMGMFDADFDGTIGWEEFQKLWKFIDERREVFRRSDRNNNMTIEATELQRALQDLRYEVPRDCIDFLMYKYGTTSVETNRYGVSTEVRRLTFDHFIRACVTVKHLADGFKEFEQDKGWVRMDFLGFMRLVLSAP